MSVSFEQLKAEGLLAPVHIALAESFRRLDRHIAEELVLVTALTSDELSRGHVCLNLKSLNNISFEAPEHDSHARSFSDWPSVDRLTASLQDSQLVTVVQSQPEAQQNGHARCRFSRTLF